MNPQAKNDFINTNNKYRLGRVDWPTNKKTNNMPSYK